METETTTAKIIAPELSPVIDWKARAEAAEAEVQRLRRGYRISPEDVRAAGVRPEQAIAWLRARGWSIEHRWRSDGRARMESPAELGRPRAVVYLGADMDDAVDVELAVEAAASVHEMVPLDVLAAMAAEVTDG